MSKNSLLSIKDIKNFKANKVWFFRFKKFWDDFLLTTETGKYAFVEPEDFSNLISGNIDKIDKTKKSELESVWIIKNKEYEDKMVELYSKKNHFINQGPSLHIVVVTLRCNHKCKYCHAAAAPEWATTGYDMTVDMAKKVVDTIFFTTSNSVNIEFQWWEPLLNWEVIEYITTYAEEKAKILNKKLYLSVVTNAAVMTDTMLDFFVEHDFGVSISLDWDEELHNYNRTYKPGNSYEKTVYWIEKINKVYKENEDKLTKPKVWAILTVTKKTLPKWKEIIDIYASLWLDSIFLRPLNPYWFASADLANLWYTPAEFLEFYKNALDYIIEKNKEGIYFKEIYSLIFLSKILSDYDPNFLDERSPCWAWIGQIAYNYDWQLYTCDEWRMLARMWIDDFKVADLWNWWLETYKNVINSTATKSLLVASTTDTLPWYDEDVYKPYLWVCPIYNYKMEGNIFPNYSLNEKRKIETQILDILFEKLKNEENKANFLNWIYNSNKSNSDGQCLIFG